jgi:hypothetical protein
VRCPAALARHRSDAHARAAALDHHRVPRIERDGRGEAFLPKIARRVFGGDDGQIFLQALFDDAVEVVAVVVREHAEINRRQFFEFDGRVGQAFGRQAVAEMHVVARVQEIRVGQDRETGVAQYHRRRPDEEDRAAREVGARAARRRRRSSSSTQRQPCLFCLFAHQFPPVKKG